VLKPKKLGVLVSLMTLLILLTLSLTSCSSNRTNESTAKLSNPVAQNNDNVPATSSGNETKDVLQSKPIETKNQASNVAPKSKNITAQELTELIKTDTSLVMIDVGTTGEYKEGHIKGSIWGDMGQLRKQAEQYLTSLGISKTAHIVLICETGSKSNTTIPYLTTAGYQTVYNLEGGRLGWLRAGYKLSE
jgi:rhodanese-related sulfurtransferase